MHKGVVTCLAVLCLATVGFVQDLPSQSISNGATAVPFCHDDDSRFSALDAVADMDSLAQAIRAIHPSPDWARPAGHFETGAAAIINEVRGGAQCTGSLVYYASRMLALAADGHSRVTNAMLDSVLGRLPYRMVWRGDQLILRVLPSKDSAHLGSEVVSINRIPVRELMDRLRPIVPHNDSFEFLRYSERYLFKTRLINGLTGRPLNDPITVTVRTATGTVDFNASPIDMSSREALQPGADVAVLERQRQPPIAERDIRRYVRWEVVGDVFLLRLNAVLNQDGAPFTASIGRAFAAFDTSRTNRMVVDLRGNGGGNGGFAPFVTAAIRARPVLQRPGAVLVATDKYTYSAAVTLRNDLVYRAGAISIGEPAGG